MSLWTMAQDLAQPLNTRRRNANVKWWIRWFFCD